MKNNLVAYLMAAGGLVDLEKAVSGLRASKKGFCKSCGELTKERRRSPKAQREKNDYTERWLCDNCLEVTL